MSNFRIQLKICSVYKCVNLIDCGHTKLLVNLILKPKQFYQRQCLLLTANVTLTQEYQQGCEHSSVKFTYLGGK